MASHVVWVNKHKPKPKWLMLSNSDVTDPHNLHRTIWYRYWHKIWQATPLWATREPIAAVYKEAEERRAAGEDVVVDHIVPLANPYVCGLHWHHNLQVIDRKLNALKSNHDWPDSVHENQLELDL